MNKLFVTAVIAFSFCVNAFSETYSAIITNGVSTNLYMGGGVIKNITIANAGATVQSFALYDSKYNTLLLTNQAYISRAAYVTNYPYIWTNYFGVTNAVTNVAYVQYSVTNLAGTNAIARTTSFVVPAGTTLEWADLSYPFIRGITFTNTSAAAGTNTVTVTTETF